MDFPCYTTRSTDNCYVCCVHSACKFRGAEQAVFLSHCVDDAMIDIQAVLWASLLATVKEIQIQQYATIFFCSGARYIYCTYASYFHYNVEVKNAHIF